MTDWRILNKLLTLNVSCKCSQNTTFTLETRQTVLSHDELLRSQKSQIQWLVASFFARIKFRDVKKEIEIIKVSSLTFQSFGVDISAVE